MSPLRRILLLTAIAASLSTSVRAAPLPEQLVVTTGIFVNQIHEVNLKDNFFVADIYIWFRWVGDERKPHQTWSIVDGRIESKGEVQVKKLPDGITNYAYLRVVVKVTKYWDVTRYPLDRHRIIITVEEEDSVEQLLRYEADTANSGVDPRVKMPGWVIANLGASVATAHYESNFGDTALPTGNASQYTRVSQIVGLTRLGHTYFVKLFFALWIAVAISLLSFLIKPTNVDPRFGLGVGAMFAAIASEYAVTSGLPEIGVATLADRLHVIAYGAIFFSIAESTASLWLVEHGRENISRRLDRTFAVLMPISYLLANVLIVVLR